MLKFFLQNLLSKLDLVVSSDLQIVTGTLFRLKADGYKKEMKTFLEIDFVLDSSEIAVKYLNGYHGDGWVEEAEIYSYEEIDKVVERVNNLLYWLNNE